MKYPLSCGTWDHREIEAIQKVIKSGRYTMGARVKQFEEEFASHFMCKDAVMVNSGSTANLLILATLAEKYKLQGNIIVPAVAWSTTYYPLYQYDFTINFVDIDKHTLNIDPEKVEAAINPMTCAIFAVNLLGNGCEYKKLMLIEDNCESLGSITDTQEYAGTVGQLGSYSFFYSHHLQTMEGGMIACKDTDDADFIRSMRSHGWCRDLPDDNKLHEKSGDKFKDSFTFIVPGYNVRPLEMSGAIGSVQLKKWPEMRNKEKFKDLPITTQKEIGSSSWFGFSIVLEDKLAGHRDIVVKELESQGVECRPIVAGNFMKNPVIEYLSFLSNGDYKNADSIHENGFFIGNDIIDLKENIDLVFEIIKDIYDHLRS